MFWMDWKINLSPFLSAEQFVDRLIDAVTVLQNHPELGRRVPEAEERNDVRELIFHSYRIIYLLDTEQAYILTVIHGSRDLVGPERKPWEMV